MQHRSGAEAVDEAGPEPVARDAGQHEQGVENRDLGIGNLQAVEHKDAVERPGQPNAKGPQAKKEGGAAEVGVVEGLQEVAQARALFVGGGRLLGEGGAEEIGVPQEAKKRPGRKDPDKAARSGKKVEELADRKTGDHSYYGADDGLAAGKARPDILWHGVGDPSAVKGRNRIAAEHAEADHGDQGREPVLRWDQEGDEQR